MIMKNKQVMNKFQFRLSSFGLLIFISMAEIGAQIRSIPVAPPPAKTEDFTWWYVTLFILMLGLAGTIFWRLNSKKAKNESAANAKLPENDNNASDRNSLDAEKELEWLRKNPKLIGKKTEPKSRRKKRPSNLPQAKKAVIRNETEQEISLSKEKETNSPALPIFSIRRLELARPFDVLPISNDEDLMSAIEQSYDEFEEDEEVRELAVRILAAFKKRNSVEALSQIALYDLSSNLRSKAVSVISEFDHESVFETIILACADPTREVRAAAARGLTKLTFDRADAWLRIAETGEDGRIVQAARAAMESGFVDMSFDRLASKDHKQAYEAFTLMALLIKAGETEKIFKTLEDHRDMNVRKAILHIIKVTKDQRAVDGLYTLLEKNTLPIDFQEEVDRTIEEIGFVTA